MIAMGGGRVEFDVAVEKEGKFYEVQNFMRHGDWALCYACNLRN